jgi:hypothetical protein
VNQLNCSRFIYSDIFSIITDSSLLPDCEEEPASYLPVDTYTLPDGKESTVEDICDFFVQYINSDVLVHLAPSFFSR